LIGVWPDLLEHVEIIRMAGLSHSVEDADITSGNVGHTQTKHGSEAIRTHHGRTPRMSGTPIMSDDYGAWNFQGIEKAHQVSNRLQRGVRRCLHRSGAAAIAAHIRRYCSIPSRGDCVHLSAPGVRCIGEPMAEEHDGPVSLLREVQGNAIRRDVIFFDR
jgi:hypothetical protein